MADQGEKSPPTKRRKLDTSLPGPASSDTESRDGKQGSLHRPISPPLSRRTVPIPFAASPIRDRGSDDERSSDVEADSATIRKQAGNDAVQDASEAKAREGPKFLGSPIQLTRIKDLPSHKNVDTVSLKDILGDPMIKECWNFNFLFDLDFVMKHFDDDVRDIVKVKIIHGFWKNDDERRIRLLEAAEQYPNIQLLHAYIPDPFGTHHTKMLILFRHDNFAQIIIHTANMISRDWGNMTQAVWRSPLLPFSPVTAVSTVPSLPPIATPYPIGSGERFKVDILRYLNAYGNRLLNLTKQLRDYDFSAVRAAFIGSAPSRQKPGAAKASLQTSYGWLGLQEVLSAVPIRKNIEVSSPPHIVLQVSSIATLGAAPTWLTNFESVLARCKSPRATNTPKISESQAKPAPFFARREAPNPSLASRRQTPTYSIIFPTPEEIRTSLDGWASGGSIHMKLQSDQQQKQLTYLHPKLCHWKHLSTTPDTAPSSAKRYAFRGPAAPHIKTYIRFTDQTHSTIDWAMVTSANLSKQAWGDVVSKKDEIWIQSWEAGVVVWPELFADDKEDEALMVPVFGADLPGPEDVSLLKSVGDDNTEGVKAEEKKKKVVVGFRMPYDLPLESYASEDRPWCATMKYGEPDWKGLAWGGY